MPEKPSCKKLKTEDGNICDDSDEVDPIVELKKCHEELDRLNEKDENGMVIATDEKSRKLRQECYKKRNNITEKISDFWITVFTSHPDLSKIITEEEEHCLSYLHKLEVDIADNNYSGYSIKFFFKDNPYFNNEILVKDFVCCHDKMASKSTKIVWFKPQKKTAAKKAGKKRGRDESQSFFEWFANNDDPAHDKIAEIIKDDVWVNSLHYYLPDFDSDWEDESNANWDDSYDEEYVVPFVELEQCQEELDKLNEEEDGELIMMDEKSRKLRQECYEKRNKIIEKIPDFWFAVFTGHPDLYNIITEEEEHCLSYLHKLEVTMADNDSGYSIKFFFKDNPYFNNEVLVKQIFYNQGNMTSESTKIDWFKPQKKSAAKRAEEKRGREEPQSFFEWFADNDDPAHDKIAEIIKDQIWANSLHYYLPDLFDVEWEDESTGSSDGEEGGDKTNGEDTTQASGDGAR